MKYFYLENIVRITVDFSEGFIGAFGKDLFLSGAFIFIISVVSQTLKIFEE